MHVVELSFDYWNKLADQMIVISSLLGGFSIAVIANFLVSDTNTRLSRNIMKAAVLAAGSFLVSLFAMTNILMMTTDGFFREITEGDLIVPRIIGIMTLLLGIISLVTMIALAGWTKSKSMGRFTTTIGILTLILILLMM